MIAKLLTARQRDLADNELDIRRHSEKLVELMRERANINEDIAGLECRLEDDKTKADAERGTKH